MKDFKKLGKALSKAEQKMINGGRRRCEDGCFPNNPCCLDGFCMDHHNLNQGLCPIT